MADLCKNLAKNIRQFRGNMTQEVFARKVGINQASINRIEQGTQNVTIKTLQKLCDSLKCKTTDLLDK